MLEEDIENAIERAEMNHERLRDMVHDQYDEIERLKSNIKMALDYIQNAKGKDINYVATLLLGYPIEISEMREQFLESIGSDKE